MCVRLCLAFKFAIFALLFLASSSIHSPLMTFVEVVNYASAIAAELEGDYEIACEHEHSNCILLADTKFLKDGEWYTWIDFDKVRISPPWLTLFHSAAVH